MPKPDLDRNPVLYLGDQPEGFEPHVGEDGKAYMAQLDQGEDDRPSLSRPYRLPGSSGAMGIGGTVVGAENSQNAPQGQQKARNRGSVMPLRQSERPMTAEEMMAQAEMYEQDFLNQTRQVEASGRTGSTVNQLYGDQFEPQGEPDWLKQYMERQPPTDPYHQTAPSKVDMVNNNKYLDEREALRIMKYANLQ